MTGARSAARAKALASRSELRRRLAVASAFGLAILLLLATAVLAPAFLRSDVVGYERVASLGTDVLLEPIGVAYLDGRLYVTDAARNRVVVFDTGGPQLDEWDGGAEGFARPMHLGPGANGRLYVAEYLADRVATGIHVSSDTVYVADFYNHTIQVFDGGGRYLGRIDGALNLPTAVTRGGRGELYVADFGNGRVLRFDPRRR